jgi:hypothetical protein
MAFEKAGPSLGAGGLAVAANRQNDIQPLVESRF